MCYLRTHLEQCELPQVNTIIIIKNSKNNNKKTSYWSGKLLILKCLALYLKCIVSASFLLHHRSRLVSPTFPYCSFLNLTLFTPAPRSYDLLYLEHLPRLAHLRCRCLHQSLAWSPTEDSLGLLQDHLLSPGGSLVAWSYPWHLTFLTSSGDLAKHPDLCKSLSFRTRA